MYYGSKLLLIKEYLLK